MFSHREIKLWKRFWPSLVKCFFFSIPTVIFPAFFFWAISGLFSTEKIDNYAKLIPQQFWKPFNKDWDLSKSGFVLFGILAVGLFFLFFYLYDFYAQKLIIKISAYLKNKTLKKFRNLPLEEQLKRKGEISTLIEQDNEIVSCHWVNFWRKLFEGCFNFGLFFYAYFYYKWQSKQQGEERFISDRTLFYTFFYLVLIIGITYLFYRVNYRLGKVNKKTTTRERTFINWEINNMVLVNSMGLGTSYEKKQCDLTEKSNQAKITTEKVTNLESAVPWRLLVNLFPFGLLALEPNRVNIGFETVWSALNNCIWAFGYLWNWSDYTSSRARVNTFLDLPERDNNLQGTRISTEIAIKRVRLENVSFRYQGQKEAMVFNQDFVTGEVNYLTTPNGSGKTTKLYLLLGLLTPQKGKIIIEMRENKSSYNLSELDSVHWRNKNVAYCSHETLIKEGSSGQKQLYNIDQILKNKRDAQIFIFDEADNALDKERQIWFQERLKELVKRGKIVICAK